MPFRIRTKLITAFISVLLPILVLFVFNHFQLKALHNSILQVEEVANERDG